MDPSFGPMWNPEVATCNVGFLGRIAFGIGWIPTPNPDPFKGGPDPKKEGPRGPA